MAVKVKVFVKVIVIVSSEFLDVVNMHVPTVFFVWYIFAAEIKKCKDYG